MKCDICGTTAHLITEEMRSADRADYPGVDFYISPCVQCWEVEKARR